MPQSTAPPRRSQRDRKQVKQFASSTSTPLPFYSHPHPEQRASPRTSAREPRNLTRSRSPISTTETTPRTTTTTRTQSTTTTSMTSPHPNPRNALPRPANQRGPLPQRNRAPPSLPSQSRDAPKQSLQTAISIQQRLLQTQRSTQITHSSVRPLHTHPAPCHLILLHRHPTQPLRRAPINRRGLPSHSLTNSRSSTSRTDQLHLACMWLQ